MRSGLRPSRTQGCLVLPYCGRFKHEIDVESGPPAGISDVVASGGPDQIVCEGSQARDDIGVLSDAASVLGKGGVAHVVTAILNAPMRANPFVPALGRLVGSGGNPEDGLVGLLAKSGLGIALADHSLQAEHGLDEAVPRRTAEPRLGWKHRQFAGFPAVAARGLALVRTGWLSSCGSQFKLTAQARLVVLDLGEQMIARGDHALERFFGRVRRRA